MNLREDAKPVIEEPHVYAMQLGSVDVNADSRRGSNKALLRDERSLDGCDFGCHGPHPEPQSLVSRAAYLCQMLMHIVDGRARDYEAFDSGETNYLGRAAASIWKPEKFI